MCGVLAILTSPKEKQSVQAYAPKMLQTLQESRGPDAGHLKMTPAFENKNLLVMGHARLSIIDLSTNANQPMVDPKTGFMLSFNGEIYNYRELKAELAPHYDFVTESDTEVLLAALQRWGLKKTLSRIRGMFAFVAYDVQEHELIAARDPAGEKPLMFGTVGDDLIFTSDMRTLKHHPNWRGFVSLNALKEYFSFRFVSHPETIFKNIYKLPPGTYLKYSKATFFKPEIEPYFEPYAHMRMLDESLPEDVRFSIEKSMKRVVETSDVPMGCFLSGGIDSSLVATLAKKHREDLIAYTIQFQGSDYDESKNAKALTKTLGMQHRVVPFGFPEFRESFYEMLEFLDEPSAVHSLFPLGYLARIAKREVKVCLSGDGGDELFAGYNRHIFWQNHMTKILKYSSRTRETMHSFLSNKAMANMTALFMKLSGVKQAKSKVAKIRRSLEVGDVDEFYYAVLAEGHSPLDVQLGLPESILRMDGFKTPLEKLLAMDYRYYLPNDVLSKVDHATMAFGLESRAPLLDRDVFDLAKTLPLRYKINKDHGKLFLKKWLYELNPEYNFPTAKMGFTTPVEKWKKELLDEGFQSVLQASSLYQFIMPSTRNMLMAGRYPDAESFALFSLVHWLKHHKLTVVS